MSEISRNNEPIFSEIKQLIQSAKQRAALAVNAELTLLYWQVGKLVSRLVPRGERAEYGKQVIENLAKDLTQSFGKGWSSKQLRHCLRFAETFFIIDITNDGHASLCPSYKHVKTSETFGEPIESRPAQRPDQTG